MHKNVSTGSLLERVGRFSRTHIVKFFVSGVKSFYFCECEKCIGWSRLVSSIMDGIGSSRHGGGGGREDEPDVGYEGKKKRVKWTTDEVFNLFF